MERRLIDANALALELFNKARNTRKRYTTPDGYLSLPWSVIADGIEQAIQSVDQAPAIDAVEVVRCQECKHWDNSTTSNDPFIGTCKLAKYYVGANGYCVYGVRREPDENAP